MESLGFTGHRFCVAPMLDGGDSPVLMGYVEFEAYYRRTVQTYPQVLANHATQIS